MLLFDIQSEYIKGQTCGSHRCPTCNGETLARTSVINYLSFTVLPLVPLKVTEKYVCNRCLRKQDANPETSELFPKVSLFDWLKKSIGIPVLVTLILLFNLYQDYQAQWQSQARQKPKVNDVLYVNNYLRTGSNLDKTFPIRLAKVVEIDLKTQSVTLDLSRVSYIELDSAQKDYAVRNHIFDGYYMEHTINMPLSSLGDNQLVLNIRRPLGDYDVANISAEQTIDKYLDIGRFVNQQLLDVRKALRTATKYFANMVYLRFKTLFVQLVD